MRKTIILVLALILLLTLSACGDAADGESTTSPASDPAPAPTEAAPASEYYFADNVLVSEDVRIEITDWRVIPVGEEGNEYGDVPVIAFWYTVTNLSGSENVTPIGSWIAMFTAVQDNDPNMVNELEVGMLPDDAYLDTQMATVKEGGTVPCAIAYELDDTTTPVVLTATRGLLGEELGEQTFNIA